MQSEQGCPELPPYHGTCALATEAEQLLMGGTSGAGLGLGVLSPAAEE